MTKLHTADFDYELPPQLIAQHPSERRDGSRLLIYQRATGAIRHGRFNDLMGELRENDLLIVNDSRVIPARLRGSRPVTGGAVEILLLEEIQKNEWWTLLRPSKRLPPGAFVDLRRLDGGRAGIRAEVLEKTEAGECRLRFHHPENLLTLLGELGEVPLPPYIKRPVGPTSLEDVERYQTVYAQLAGSVAAPTAGLHFTSEHLETFRNRGIQVAPVTLHVGPGTFAPVKSATLEEHPMHEERYFLPNETFAALQKCRSKGGRVVAVGTTSLRVLESAAEIGLEQAAGRWLRTRLFVYPPRQFQIVEALLTNFHLPQSTLLMLVSAFFTPGKADGREKCLATYQEAVRENYRFFSYGDAMFIS